tara:strand:- start:2206 stop:2430 length:225 start_codon:yes stop_codon:yes gene_type:complete
MRFYFINVTTMMGDSFDKYYTSKKKAQKARGKYRRSNDYDVCENIFYRDIEPTKIGILRVLNTYGGGTPIEGDK